MGKSYGILHSNPLIRLQSKNLAADSELLKEPGALGFSNVMSALITSL
jgi:hypothetical protein